jgi:DNA-binding NarL/FixJ family response regulator
MGYRFHIIEDDLAFSKVLIGCLDHFEAEIQVFPSAEIYLEKELDIPSLLFLDIQLPGISGISLARIMKEKNSEIKIIVLSALDSNEILFQALKAGAIGYILKSDLNRLDQILPDILQGGAFLTPTLALRVLKSFQEVEDKKNAGFEALTEREKEILQELVEGLKTKEIAEDLDVSILTVATHTKNIYRKLQVNNRVQLLRRAEELKLI